MVECLIAMLVSLIGFAGILSLLVTSIRTELISRDLSWATSVSRSKVEELKTANRSAGGSLTENITGYHDDPDPKYVRRWLIVDDASGTQTVTVAILPKQAGVILPQVELTTRMQ